MKQFILLVMLSAGYTTLAQKPEKIFPNTREHKNIAYLKEQAAAWKKVTESEPGNAAAWYNYYYAHRNLNFNDTTDKRSLREKHLFIETLVNEMSKSVPDSYEYNLVKWLSGGWNMSLLPYLQKAQQIAPERSEHLDYSIVMSEIEGKTNDRDLYSKRKYEAGQFSTGMLYYNCNVLMGLAPNTILLTSGDNDTYPVWYLQSIGIRKDVKIVHLSLLMIKEYQESVFKELGIEKWEFYSGKEKDSTRLSCEKYKSDIVEHIARNKKGYPVYVALTSINNVNSDKFPDKLYLTGLAYLYSKQPVDNIAMLKRNFEREYALDYIDKPFYTDISSSLVKMINGNYIIPMIKLYDHYKIAGDKPKEEWIKNKILSIAKGAPDENEIKKHLALNN